MEIGGQAVIEGVMMRNKERFAVAVRSPEGKIRILKDNSSKYHKVFSVPFIRGVVGLGYALYDGVRALVWSSNQSTQDKHKLSKKEIIITITAAMVMSIGIFVVIPFFSAHIIAGDSRWFDALDGIFRIVLLIAYLVAISRISEVKRLFAYHGAEHKTIHCYEAAGRLSIANVRKFPRFHPRCGTSFIFFVFLISVALFSLISGSVWVKLAGRILLLPVIAALGYEIIKLSAKFSNNWLTRAVVAPGLYLQRITTREPDDSQLEVAIASLKAVLR